MDSPKRCIRCQSELPKDSGFCVGCGFQNIDLQAKSATAQIARQEQVDSLKARIGRARALRGILRFLGR
jgi:hypothetical protein